MPYSHQVHHVWDIIDLSIGDQDSKDKLLQTCLNEAVEWQFFYIAAMHGQEIEKNV